MFAPAEKYRGRNICVLVSLAPQGFSRKPRRQAINHKSLTAPRSLKKVLSYNRGLFIFTRPLASEFSPSRLLLIFSDSSFLPVFSSTSSPLRLSLRVENFAVEMLSWLVPCSPCEPEQLAFNLYCPDVSVIKPPPLLRSRERCYGPRYGTAASSGSQPLPLVVG